MAKKSLLLVDADSKSLRMLEVSLRKSGFSVTTAIHATDAREKLKHSAPDLIITDTKLPGDENGFDFVANLKRAPETASIPIIFLSSENRLEQKVTGLELGVEDYLTKPIYIKEVLTRVRVLLDKREKQTLEKRERSSSFAGMLGDMGLVDLMQTVEIGRKTGRLHVETRSQKGTISFKEGKVTGASCGRLTGERAFYRMLVWNEGAFSMEFGAFDDADVIELSTQGLLMEGMRRVDEWGRLIEQLPPLDHIFEIDFNELVDRLAEIPDEINMLLRLFDGRRTMLQVVDETDFGDLEALEIASKLYFEGLIFDVSDREPAEPSQPQKVEAWLSEPAGANDDDAHDDDAHDDDHDDADDRQILAPNSDSVLPQPATSPSPPVNILAPPSGAGPTPTMPPSLPNSTPPLQAQTIASARTTTSEHLPRVQTPRPLPAPGNEDQEPRTVVPRSAVGATAWSSARKKASGNDDEWEDVLAPDDHTPAEGKPSLPPADGMSPSFSMPDGATPSEGVRIAAPPPPSLLSSTPTPLTSMSPLSLQALSAASLSLSTAATLPPSASSSSPSGTEPTSPAAAELARDLGLSDDELALALAADDRNERNDGRGDDDVATLLEQARPADDDALAASIAAQLDDSSEGPPDGPVALPARTSTGSHMRPPSLPPELAGDDDDKVPDRDTDKGRRNTHGKKPPAPPPETGTPLPGMTSTTPSSGPSSATSGGRDTLVEADADQRGVDGESIHERHTRLDIEPVQIDRFGVSKPMAAGVFAVGFIVVAGLVVALGGDEKPTFDVDAGGTVAAIVDAGSRSPVTAPIVTAPDDDTAAADAGTANASTANVVVDAGSKAVAPPAVPPAVVDAGSKPTNPTNPTNPVNVATVVDAGTRVDPLLPTGDPQADYARHLKAADGAAKRGEFAKSVRSYKAALALDKDAQAAHLGLGNAYYELDNLPAAITHLERARALAPKDPQVFVLLGAVYQSAGRKSDAVSAYERYLELAPEGKFARDVKGILRGLKN